jgi:crotonobetainyl-CoA:carnitine CoA-transferase CaiB-like acyl-CoA transferase
VVAALHASGVEDADLNPAAGLAGRLTVTGPADVLPSRFRVTTVAAAAVAAVAAGAGRLWSARTGEPEPAVTVDTRHAAVAFRSERYIKADQRRLPNPWDPLTGYYPTADGRWIQLHCNFPHHRDGILALLRVPPDRRQVERVVSRVDAAVLESELTAMGMCATMVRSEPEWLAHPQGRALAGLPLMEFARLGDAPARPLKPSARPAGGVRVLDMTRVTAGPVCGRVLAAYGATVLRVGAAHLPEVPTLAVDTGFGKRNTNVDLRDPAGVRRMRELVAGADVVVQAFRPKALDRIGFGPEALARMRPGIVCVTITAYGRLGPWSGLRGFDSLVQTASGIAHAGGAARGVDEPVPLPAQVLDHATGHFAAFAAMAMMARRQRDGGSWHARLSLAQTGRWLQGLGYADADALAIPDLRRADVEPWSATMRSELGELSYVRPAGTVGSYTPHWQTPPVPLGSSPPTWGP